MLQPTERRDERTINAHMDPSRQGLLSPGSDGYPSLDADEASYFSGSDATEPPNGDPLPASTKSTAKHSHLPPWKVRCISLRRLRSRCCIIALVVGGIALTVLTVGGGLFYRKVSKEPPYGQSPPWYPSPKGGTAKSWADSYQKASLMVRRMTLAEKVNITTGTGWEMGLAVGTTGPAVFVGFPQLSLQDGPLGLRFADNATAFPAGVTVGATWNRDLMYHRGKAHAAEARGKGINVILGPCVGPLGRMPAGGRNWEGFGADPYLQGVASAQTILGIQSEGVMATVKHFVANEQEHFRQPWEWGLPHALSANIDDRTLHELYAWPFGDAIKAGVASVMCSYNMVNNSYACGNSKLLNGILKDELGFQGFVMSDWLAQRSGVSTALAGLDMTMPGDGLLWQNGKSLWGPELTRSVLNGSVPMERLNDMVTRIVAAWYRLGQDDPASFDGSGPNFSSWTHNTTGQLYPGSPSPQATTDVNKFINVQGNHSTIAHRVAAEGTVLLKNVDNCLPMSTNGITGSRPHRRREDAAAAAKAHTELKVKIGIFGEDAGPGHGPNFCRDRGCNQGTLGSGWGSGAVEFPYLVPPIDALSARFDMHSVELEQHLSNYASDKDYVDLDICIIFANADSGEGYLAWDGVGGDRNDLLLQNGGEDLVYTVARDCGGGSGEVIVVIHSVGPVVMERWIDLPNVKAVLYANLPGQESGSALADVLFGAINPSGKLPYTIGRSLEDYGAGGKIMYLPNSIVPQQDFGEGLYIDYRHFDKKDIDPRFEFGFGLSYTSFELGNLTVHALRPKTALPAPRPPAAVLPPEYENSIPDKKEALFPSGFRQLKKYVYPYLNAASNAPQQPYSYPEGYDIVRPPSGAGGEEGGNPDLWEAYVAVSLNVRNAGTLAGHAVIQLYLSYPDKSNDARNIEFPVKVLRGFDKVWLNEHETQSITFNLTRRDLSYWDVKRQNWVIVTDGKYQFLVGQSSRDLPLQGIW